MEFSVEIVVHVTHDQCRRRPVLIISKWPISLHALYASTSDSTISMGYRVIPICTPYGVN